MSHNTLAVRRSLLVGCLVAAAAGATVQATVPGTVNYQGRLTSNDSPPVVLTLTVPMTFSIWDNSMGGAQLWSEAWAAVTVNDGVFNVTLGSQTPIPASVFASGAPRWLELTVDGETLQPRQELSSVGWAFTAEGSAALGGVPSTGWQRRITGTCAPGSSIRVVDAAGDVTCEPDDTSSGGGSIPTGAVVFFNLPACPVGWSELTSAQGRYIVGLPPGGTVAGAVGTALGNLENRPVGLHSHPLTDPGHSHLYVPPVQTSTGSGSTAARVGSATQTGVTTTGITMGSAGSVSGTNAPYLQLLACQKD